MGKEHWAKHAAKPAPVYGATVSENVRLVVRERPDAKAHLRFVASLVYIKPPRPGQHLVAFRYGSSIEEAKRKVMALV